MAVEVRQVLAAEHAEAGRVTRAAFAALYPGPDRSEYLDSAADVAGRADRTTVLVAVEDGRILGSITVELESKVDAEHHLEPGQAHLRLLGVVPEAQGRGVGRRLMEAAAGCARAAGKRRLTLGTMPENTAARHLYETLGYRAGDRVEFAPGRWAVSYELRLGELPAGEHRERPCMSAEPEYQLVADISSDDPSRLGPVIASLITGTVTAAGDGFHVEGTARGDSARDLNRALLSALRAVERRTRLRAAWTRDGVTERFFDYVPKGTRPAG